MTAVQSDAFFLTQKRWQIALTICLGMIIVQGMRCNFPAAKIIMMDLDEFNWTEHDIASFESSFFYGYGLSQIPAGIMATKFSPPNMLGISLFLCGLCNVLTALSFNFNLNICVVIAQIVQGVGFGLSQPAIHGILRSWAPPQERAKLTSTAFNGLYLAVLFGSGISGSISVIHWSLPFYFYGAMALLWTVLWFCTSSSHPRNHRSISEAELNHIVNSIGDSGGDTVKLSEVPWLAMLTSLPVWATILVDVALNWNIFMFINQQVYYLNSVFGIPPEQAGWVVAPSQILQTAAAALAGIVSDYLLKSEKCSKKVIRKGFLCLGLTLQAMCLTGLGTIASNSHIAVFLMIMACGTIGLTFTAYLVNHFDIAPRYAPLILGINNTVGAFAGTNNFIIEPLAAQGEGGWKMCYLIGAGINVCGMLSFLLMGSVGIQPWANRDKQDEKSKKALELDAEALGNAKQNAEIL